jgi:hypothetical protein
MKPLISLLLLIAAGFTAVLAQSAATPDDPFTREHNSKRAQNPEGLLFTVRIKDNRKQFHHGEVITLELSFATSKPDTLTLDSATYDRSGRLHSDPKGTLFTWSSRDDTATPDLFQQIKDYLEEHGMKLEQQPEQKP